MPETNPPYDNDNSDKPVTRPDLRAREGINNATGAGSAGSTNNTGSSSGGASSNAGSDNRGAASGSGGKKSSYNNGGPGNPQDGENPSGDGNEGGDQVGKGYNYGNSNSTGKGKARFRMNRRRAAISITTVGSLVSVVVFFFSIASGPFEFVDFAKLLERFHFSSNEDFGNDRGSNALIYGLLGDSERTRLGIKGNAAADIWEKYLAKTTGLQPVYSSVTRRFVGYAIVDDDKAFSTLLDASDRDKRTTSHLEGLMGNGAEIQTAGEASAGKQSIVFGGGEKLDDATKLIDVSNVTSFADRRALIKTIGSSTNTWDIVSTLASRLEIKRAGVDFHPLKDIKRKATDKVADYVSKVRDAQAQEESTGTQTTTLGHDTTTDSSGKPTETPATATATNDANTVIAQAEQSTGTDALGQLAEGAGTGGAALGILCAAKSEGSDITKFKYANDALPMMRMGMTAITEGNQVMSGQGANLDELGALDKSFFNPTDKTSFTDAKSIQAELGQPQNGPDLPPEARLKNINNKPAFFNALDNTPLLGTSCNITGAIAGLPIISDVSSLASDAVTGALNSVASVFGTSTDEIMKDALAAVSGKSVNTLASGAEYGNLANTGAFLAADDNAISMGGAALSSGSVAELKTEQKIADAQDNADRPIMQRYLDPYNSDSLVASLLERIPASSSQFASSLGDIPSLLSGSLHSIASIFAPFAAADAASSGYDYGVPTFGFSPAERDDPTFTNPYDNAKVIEQPGVLDSLNSKYGQPCFGMTVTADDTGVHVQTESMGSDDLNVFKVMDKPQCNPATNNDPMFLRYRFYLSDSVAVEGLDCYEGSDANSDQSCTDLGLPSGTGASDSGPSGPSDISAYSNPFHDMTNVVTSRIDEGVDYAAKTGTTVPVYAIGNGTVGKVALNDGTSNWWNKFGGYSVVYTLTDGPAAGKNIYVAEWCPVRPGIGTTIKTITSSTVLCDMTSDSIETGWAKTSSSDEPSASDVYQEGYETAYGVNFNQLLLKLGAPGGHLDVGNDPSGKVLGSLPSGWPTW
jgi:hypothetical protein